MAIKINLDRTTGYAYLWLLVAYVYAFGAKHIHGFHIGNFSPAYAIILIPIWAVDGFKSFFESFLIHKYHESSENLSKITVVIACKDGQDVIGATLQSLLKRFKKHQIIVASNGSSDKTCEIARSYGVVLLDYRQPLGKVRAINKALTHVKTPYVLLLDDDTLVGSAKMPTGLLDEGYEAVAFRVLVKRSTWVTQLQSYEYRKSTDISKRFHNKNASVQNISGAIGLFSLKHLKRQVQRHTGEFSGEDLQRTLLIHLSQGSKGVVLARSTVTTQPPQTLKGLFDQRIFGWFPGLYANFNNYFKIMTRDIMPMALRVDAFYNCFLMMLLDILRLLSLPILFYYPWYFVVMYGMYLALEGVSFIIAGVKDPLWVLLVYPLYGLFGFVTRICAFGTFLYRRLAAKTAGSTFLDDYRIVKTKYKLIAICLSVGIGAAPLLANVMLNYSRVVINLGL